MARKGNPISVRLDLNRSSKRKWNVGFFQSLLKEVQNVKLSIYFLLLKKSFRFLLSFIYFRYLLFYSNFEVVFYHLFYFWNAEGPTFENKMVPSEGSHGSEDASSSSSFQTLEDAKKELKSSMITFILERIVEYIDTFEKEIKEEFPNKVSEIGTSSFIEKFKRGVSHEYGDFENRPYNLTQLKTFNLLMKEEIGEQGIESYKNNGLYINLRQVLKEER